MSLVRGEHVDEFRAKELTCIDFIHGSPYSYVRLNVNDQSLFDTVSISSHDLKKHNARV